MRIINDIRRNAGQLALIPGLLFLISCSGSTAADAGNSLMDKTKEAASKTTNVVKSAANEVKDISGDAMDKAAEMTSDAKDSMAEGAEAGMDKAKEMAAKTGDTMEKAASKAGDAMEKAASKTKEVAAKSSEVVAKKTEAAMEKVAKAIPVKNTTTAPTTSASTSTSMPSAPAAKPAEKIKEKVKEIKNTSKPAPVAISHEAFDKLLKAHVSSTGVVDYAGMKSNMAALDGYIAQLRENPARNSWSKDEQLAYWINAYNAHTIKLILDNYPVKSIKDINGGKPWDKTWIKLGDKTYSLNNIENDIIRPTFKEPRIHFAVNCAAKSCPPLHNRAWTASNLESTFESSTKKFINNANYNQISASEAKISSIFDWYGGDFGDVKAYINKYSNTKLNSSAKIGFGNYDWNLNGK